MTVGTHPKRKTKKYNEERLGVSMITIFVIFNISAFLQV